MSQCFHRVVPKHEIKNIFTNNRLVQLKLGTSIVPRKKKTPHGTYYNNAFGNTLGLFLLKLNITIYDSIRRITHYT